MFASDGWLLSRIEPLKLLLRDCKHRSMSQAFGERNLVGYICPVDEISRADSSVFVFSILIKVNDPVAIDPDHGRTFRPVLARDGG